MKKTAYLLTLSLVLTQLTGCTTAMYFDPTPVGIAQQQTYEFFIATGGFSGPKEADQRALQEINKYISAHGYRSYKILKRTYKFIPSGFKYLVEFH